HHRQRALHGLEELDHPDQAGGDVFLVGNIGLVRRNDRHAEHEAESRSEDHQPDERPHQGRDEAAALVEEAQALTPYDAAQTAVIVDGLHAPRSPVMRSNASRIDAASACRMTSGTGPLARIRPLCNTITRASESTSSMRWVAQSTASPSSRHSMRT